MTYGWPIEPSQKSLGQLNILEYSIRNLTEIIATLAIDNPEVGLPIGLTGIDYYRDMFHLNEIG